MRALLAVLLLAGSTLAVAYDHSQAAWDALLKKHVRYVENGNASRAGRSGCACDRT